VGHGERRRELERRFPGWEIWYVPREPDGATWPARPRLLINADDPEDLAAAIRAAGNPVIPDSVLLASPRGHAVRRWRPGRLEASAGLRGACRSAEHARRGTRSPRLRCRPAWPELSLYERLIDDRTAAARGPVERPGDRLDAHRAPATGQSQRQGSEPGVGSVLGSFTSGSWARRSRTGSMTWRPTPRG
jgi:hypothetical protein